MTETLSPEVESIIKVLPKAELHVHLEGSIRPITLLTLAQRNNVDLGCANEAEVIELFRFRDFRHFMDLYGACTYALRHPEDFALVTEELGSYAAQEGIRYLEVTFTPGTHYRFKGIPFDEMMGAIASGAKTSRRDFGVEMRFILDHVRGFPLEACYQTAEWCVQGRNQGVVALGLAGYEPERPASLYADAIHWAQEQGVPFVPHAGEAVGPEGIWDALKFNPTRIGHGFRAADDPALISYLREHGIVLEVCPTSNVCTGSVSSLDAHPLRRLWDAGVAVTINTDDPPMFNTTLVNEYRLAVTHFDFTPAELAYASLRAVRSSLLPPEERARMETQFKAEFVGLGIPV
jgi:adenosine deaminase